MPEPHEPQDNQTPQSNPDDAGQKAAPATKGRSLLRSAFEQVRQVTRDAVGVALGRALEQAEAPNLPEQPLDADAPAEPATESKRVRMLRTVADQLRGAADRYLAAKLDEIEARVDDKLDHIEERIDRKLVELNKQLAEMRDRELRHRLRLLKFTLLFTVLVALISLVYKWIEMHWIQ